MGNKWIVGFCGVVLTISSLVLLGWEIGNSTLKSVLPGLITMKANTAALLAIAAIVILICNFKITNPKLRFFTILLCAFMALIALLTLTEYLAPFNFKIDEFLFLDPDGIKGRFPPGRLAPITAIIFFLLALALVTGNLTKRKYHFFSQFLTIIVFFSAFQALLGYLTHLTYVFGAAFYTQMALHTAIAFIFLAAATILLHPRDGFAKAFTSSSLTSKITRRLLFSVVLVPPFFRFLAHWGFESKLYDQDFETLAQLMGSTILIAFVILSSARALFEFEQIKDATLKLEMQARIKAEDAVKSRDRFLAIASHELRTPITTLNLQNQMITSQLAHSDEVHALTTERLQNTFKLAGRQISWLLKLVEDMLDVSKVNSDQFQFDLKETDLKELVASVVLEQNAVFSLAKRELVLKGESVLVRCDPISIKKSVTHLLNNAFKYGKQAPVLVTIKRAGAMAEINVIDSGIGIDANDQQRIFGRYERAVSANEISGLGLGLYITNKMIDAHNGELTVTSQPNQGATFTIRLPV